LWIFWYVREASTAVIVMNIPHRYALLRKIFNLEAFGTIISGLSRSRRTRASRYATSTELNHLHHGKPGIRIGSGESADEFAPQEPLPLKIWQRNEYSINDTHANEAQWGEAEMKSVQRGALGTKSTVMGRPRGQYERDEDHT
jgi:hypothetical protein